MISRRRFLHTTASAGLATAAAGSVLTVEAASTAAADPLATHIDALLVEYLAEAQDEWRIARAMDAAEKAMPAWAQPGPSRLLHDGTKGGATSGWPEVAELPLPPVKEHGFEIIRRGPRDYWQARKAALYAGGAFEKQPDGSFTHRMPRLLKGEERRRVRLETIAGMRKLVARRREQLAWKAAVGLTRLEAAYDAAYERRWAVRERIEAEATGVSPAELGMLALFEYAHEQDDFSLVLLRRLAPALMGHLRRVVDDMIANGAADINETLFLGRPEGRAS
ncbi:hypothetical protein [Aureimonas leprariae]|uniref:Tat (Twin-arginine translocation) pathway signal sequence n=1 Tax=Plantimonas leprariae TaxID=2615207 RepID=A0A7V7PPY9_9HYPH|nr:hypothetical protein [Aureimonas leprariae]KAB0680178.1 hypothetical protein F6X38_08285 [Aureimonas leprariae]